MRKDLAHSYIDKSAAEARARYISIGDGMELVYMVKSAQAKEYINAGYTGTVPAFIQADVDAIGGAYTAQQVADMVVAKENQWMVLAAEIEKLRRQGKLIIDSLTDPHQIQTQCTATCALLDAI